MVSMLHVSRETPYQICFITAFAFLKTDYLGPEELPVAE
jgi:hypothetical protein